MNYDEPNPTKPTVETCLKSISDVRFLIATSFKKRIEEQEQTISQLRANVERLRKENENYSTAFEMVKISNVNLSKQLPKTGSLEWAISQMREGKKVRRGHWAAQAYIQIPDGRFITYANGDSYQGTLDLNGWQLYSEPKKELAVGQVYEDKNGFKYSIIGIRREWVAFYANDYHFPDRCSIGYFLLNYAHKLLGDAE